MEVLAFKELFVRLQVVHKEDWSEKMLIFADINSELNV